MTVLEIITYPDPVLRNVCTQVECFDNVLVDKVNDMIETMYYHNGTIGLAASQINLLDRIIVIDINANSTKDALKVLINPVICTISQNKYFREGCLSLPDYLADIKRGKKITVKFQDINGNFFEHYAIGLEAVAIQHEIDHLDGILFIDRIDVIKTALIRRSI